MDILLNQILQPDTALHACFFPKKNSMTKQDLLQVLANLIAVTVFAQFQIE